MNSVKAIRSTATHLLLGATVALWQSTIALAGTPTDDVQTQAQTLLRPPIAHSTGGREPDHLAEGKRHLNAAPEAHSQAQRLLLGISYRDSEASTPSTPAALDLVAYESSASPIGDAQEAARRMILGRDETVRHPAATARQPGVPAATHFADQ